MGTKSGICPHCSTTGRLDHRIFPVNSDASVVYCPFCMRELDPHKAIEAYNHIIDKMLSKADNTLFVACDPTTAYQQYADVLEIEKKNSRALLGRILCLIYTSKVRVSYLVEASDLLEEIGYKGVEEATTYVTSLRKINFALDEYDAALIKRLTIKDCFYDEACLKLYLKHLYDIIKFKKDILVKVNEIKANYSSINNEVFINLLNHSISDREIALKSIKYTAAGDCYKLTKVVGEKVYLEEQSQKNNSISMRLLKKRIPSLSETKGSRAIKDQVFKDYTAIIKAKKVSTFLVILFLLLAAGSGLTSYFFFEKSTLYFALLIAASGAFFALFITFIILHFSWKSILKKRKMRID